MKNKKKKKEVKIKYIYKGRKLPVKAQIVGDYLTELSQKIGANELTAQYIVSVASDKKNPLHKCFEWNDTKAAHQYRLKQAANILQSVKVEYLTDNEPVVTRAFVNIKENGSNSGFYTKIEVACKNQDYMQYLYDEGKRELLQIKEKYAAIKEFENIFKEIEKLK